MAKDRTQTVGIVPAGGKGTRLAPYPGPKELFPIGWQEVQVAGRTVVRPKVVSQYVVENMVCAGVDSIVMVVGDHKFDVLRYFGSGGASGAPISYVYQAEPRGMVHAIDVAYPWLRDKRVLLGMPDTIVRPPDAFRQMLSAHTASRAEVTLGLFSTKTPSKFGMVGVDGAGRIVEHVDKPPATKLTLMWGLAVWEPSFTELLHEVAAGKKPTPGGSELVLGEVYDEALSRGMRLQGLHFEGGRYVDIGTVDEIVDAHRLFDV